MKAFKPMINLFLVVAFVVIIIPAVLVLPFSSDTSDGKLAENLNEQKTGEKKAQKVDSAPEIDVAVYRSSIEKIQDIPLETYLVGVVSAEMPIKFELEALKAQALAARTYIVNQLVSGNRLGVPKGADVTDTVLHQVYMDDAELKKNWGTNYSKNLKKVKKAVKQTESQVLTYNGKPITATFFSTSNGYTENSEDYWSSPYPYLKSVSSPWDKESPEFYHKTVIPLASFENKLGVKLPKGETVGSVKNRTAGKRVASVEIGGKRLTGQQIREKLGLSSTDFSWERRGNQIVIATKGYGHGVGMSQYGANGMAEEGKNYKEIVQYYYQGVKIQSSATMLNTVTAKK